MVGVLLASYTRGLIMLNTALHINAKWVKDLFTESGWAWLQSQNLTSYFYNGKLDLVGAVHCTASGLESDYPYKQGTLGDINKSLLNMLAAYANMENPAYLPACQNIIIAMEAMVDLDLNNS